MTLSERVLIILATLAATVSVASAQNSVTEYQKAAGWDMPLYRGKQMTEYSYRFNGTYFWDNNGFRRASICYGGKVYDNVLMNVDAFRQALYVRYEDRIQTWELDRDLIDWAMFGNVKIVNLRKQGVAKAPEGFFEVVHEGRECIYRQVTKTYKESLEVSGYNRIGYEDPKYNENIFVYFEFHERFYFLDKKGKFERFNSKNYLIKKHPELKKQLKNQIKYNNWGDQPLIVWCKVIMDYVERNAK